MATADDVAAAILEISGPIDTFKLQKLVYYCQAWHIVWDDEELFPDAIEAWAGGPVVRTLYERHRGQYTVTTWPWGDPEQLSPSQRESVRIVVSAYGKLTGRQLSALTHKERPWREARTNLAPGERGNQVIPPEDLADYYGGLDQDDSATPVEELSS